MALIRPASLNTTSEVISMKTCGCARASGTAASNRIADTNSDRPIILTRESGSNAARPCAPIVPKKWFGLTALMAAMIMRLREIALHQPAIAAEHDRPEIGKARHENDRRARRQVDMEGDQQPRHARQEGNEGGDDAQRPHSM